MKNKISVKAQPSKRVAGSDPSVAPTHIPKASLAPGIQPVKRSNIKKKSPFRNGDLNVFAHDALLPRHNFSAYNNLGKAKKKIIQSMAIEEEDADDDNPKKDHLTIAATEDKGLFVRDDNGEGVHAEQGVYLTIL